MTHSSFSHIGPGYAFGGDRANAMAARLRYLKKHGSGWLLRGESPPAPGWPSMPVVKQGHSRLPDPVKRNALKHSIAEGVAEGQTIKAAALASGISQQYGSVLWREIVAALGWQAV